MNKPNEYNRGKREKIYKNIRNINRATVIVIGAAIINALTGVLPLSVSCIAGSILPPLLQVAGGIYQHKMGINSDEDQIALEEEFKG